MDEIFVMAVVIILLICGGFIANELLYPDRITVYCDCQVSGLVRDDTKANVAIVCQSGLTEIVDVSQLEYQSLRVGTPVVLVQSRTGVIDSGRYELMLAHEDCE